MGYDTNECLFCYTSGGGNEPTEDCIDICFTCLEEHIGSRITGRVLQIFEEYIVSSKILCEVCQKEKKLVCNVRCCNEHFKESESKENE